MDQNIDDEMFLMYYRNAIDGGWTIESAAMQQSLIKEVTPEQDPELFI